MQNSASGSAGWCRWRRFATLLNVPGACLGVLTWGAPAVLGIGIVGILVGGAVQRIALGATKTPGSVPAAQTWRTCGHTALAAGAIAAGLRGLSAISFSAAALVVVVLVLGTPPLATWLRRMLPRGDVCAEPLEQDEVVLMSPHDTAPPTMPLLLTLLAEPAPQMSRPQLCQAWRRSFMALQGARTVAERVRLVELRQTYLDELEARDAAALSAWLADGARAAGGPDRYFAAGHRQRPDAT